MELQLPPLRPVALTTGNHGRDLIIFTHFSEFVTSPYRCQSGNTWIDRSRWVETMTCWISFAFVLLSIFYLADYGRPGWRGR